MKLPDVNVLIYAMDESSPHCKAASRWLEDALSSDESTGFAWLALVGFIRISTMPALFDDPFDHDEAVGAVEGWLAQPHAEIVEPPKDGHPAEIRQLLGQAGRAGNLTNDAHLAAIAIHHNATLVSFDSDFERFERLRFERLR